jgi:2-hydroxychromene-2-carboxylate isomerase
MSQTVDFFFDFVSPYSYLAHSQLSTLDADVVLRPMHVLSVMKAVGNTPTSVTCPPKGRYAGADLGRWAQRYQVALKAPDMRTLNNGACLRAVLAATSDSARAATTTALFNACWGEGKTLLTDEDAITVVAAAGIDTDGLAERMASRAVIDQLEANNAEAAERGVFGAPTFLVGKAMFFGNDRLDFLREHLAMETAA